MLRTPVTALVCNGEGNKKSPCFKGLFKLSSLQQVLGIRQVAV